MAHSDRVVDAFAMAHELHGAQRRKGSDIPYYTHLMAVAASVGEHGGDEELVIAALLHDAAEDQGGPPTLEQIRNRFGERVARCVEGCSDAIATPKPPWLERKQAFMARLIQADPDVRLVVAADKLHNARSISRDLQSIGNDVWARFKGGREGTLWYYAEAVRALSAGWSHPILDELRDAIEALERRAEALRDT